MKGNTQRGYVGHGAASRPASCITILAGTDLSPLLYDRRPRLTHSRLAQDSLFESFHKDPIKKHIPVPFVPLAMKDPTEEKTMTPFCLFDSNPLSLAHCKTAASNSNNNNCEQQF